MPPKVISGGDNPYDIHDAKLSSSATAHESSSVTAHEISNIQVFDVRCSRHFLFVSLVIIYGKCQHFLLCINSYPHSVYSASQT